MVQAKNLALLGATDAQMAEFFNVNISTFKRWKTTKPGFSDQLGMGKGLADSKVAASLYQRATGFTQQEVDIRVISGKVVQTIYTKKYAPDVTACIYWLKNRQPELWNDRRNADIDPVEQKLKRVELEIRELEAERAKFILAKMIAAETDTETEDDQAEFMAELASRLPN